MASQCRVLIPVFWRKNFLYLRFNWIPLCLIFLFLTFCNVAYLHWTDNTSTIRMEIFESKDYVALKQLYFPANDDDKIYYAPSTENARSLVDQVRTELELPYERMLEYNSSDEMQMDMEQRCRGNCFAINFQEMPAPGDDGSFRYTLSSNQMRSLPEKRFVNDEQINHAKDDDEYIRNGFLTLQLVIDRQYMRYQRIDNNYELLLKSMPNLELSNADSNRINNSGTLFSIFFTFLLLSTFVVPYVEEKHNGIKAFLNLVTPMSFLDGLTFFSIRFFCYAFFLTITLIPAYYYHALGNSGIIFAVFLYLLYIVAQMSYAYLISVCFHSVFYAKIGGLVLFIIPYAFTFVRSWISKLACYFLCTNAFLEGLDVLQTFSNKHRELSGSDLFRIIKFDSSRLFSLYILLIFQTILYAVLYNYFACVFPGHGGLKRPLFFFLNPETYKKRQRNEYTTSPRGTDAIIISDLCKKFQSSKRETTIAQNLDMTIRNKEITVLLGHNGAGKTTIMNMIMGIVPKDSGKIIACSERDVASYRHLIGFCPQHSVFMNYMTCQQHLEFFAQLRGASRQDARLWAKEKLRKLNLTDKTNEYGCNLSGGMKRRLSLGIAIAGNTKIVILDEPSSGLDIESRRELWDILLALRKEKAILVTTHYMEEAEVLGDTICILVDGQLKANGSPLELKRKSGCGYFLKLQAHETKFLQQETLDLISNHIPNPIIQNIVKPTVYICLPYDYQKEFFNVLRSLEENMKRLGIETISITDTSLETVFLNCAGEADQVDTPDARARNDAPLLNYKRLQAPPSQWQLWRAIFYKKSTFLLNQWQYTCLMLSLPVIAVICVLFLMHSLSVVTNEAALPLKLSQLHTGTVYIYNPTGHHDKIEQQLRQYIEANGINAKTLTLRGSNSMHDELLQLQRENLADFLEDTIGVVDMYVDQRGTETTPTFELYYASNRYHSSVMLINMLDTCLLQLGKRDNQMQIEAIYVPIRRFVRDVSSSRLEYYPVIISAALFFSLFYYTSLPFREHVNGFRQLQPMSRYTYWFASFAMDALLHCGLCLILYIIQRIIMPSELYSVEEQGMIGFSFFFYGISYLPILYLLANNFKSISTISTYLLLMLIVSAAHYQRKSHSKTWQIEKPTFGNNRYIFLICHNGVRAGYGLLRHCVGAEILSQASTRILSVAVCQDIK
ncbi:ATP-binding cassette sub-family A member 9 isoform X2 [Drosophila busckii]|uniref:ATP-binding cassette sub-family A member 9 isoform X2 n=1 Tax=Drosophila busckii TaxID=30019 RepID=UPI00083F08FC|nr:ATP-binding cassette sub-family A member 9 isoform X2 [Drosophila busckii]